MSIRKPYITKHDGEVLVALEDGFYGLGRVRQGQTFNARSKGEKFSWAKPATPADVTADKGGEPNLLDKPMKDIIAALPGLSDVELNGMIAAEQAGKTRKGVLAAMGDELANRVGRVGGKTQNPAAKQPEEKEPKTPPSNAGGGGNADDGKGDPLA